VVDIRRTRTTSDLLRNVHWVARYRTSSRFRCAESTIVSFIAKATKPYGGAVSISIPFRSHLNFGTDPAGLARIQVALKIQKPTFRSSREWRQDGFQAWQFRSPHFMLPPLVTFGGILQRSPERGMKRAVDIGVALAGEHHPLYSIGAPIVLRRL
jgi:hypothetical protein